MIKLAGIMLSGFALTVTVTPAQASSLAFASFTQTGPDQDFRLTSTVVSSSLPNNYSVTITGSASVSFTYSVGGTVFGNTSQTAKLTFTATSIVSGGCDKDHPNCETPNVATFTESGFSGSFSIKRDSPFDGSSGKLSNLLSGTFLLSPGGQLASTVQSSTATLEATGTSSNPNEVVFTSDFLNFANTINRDATFDLSKLTSRVEKLIGFSVITNNGTDNRWPNNFTAMASGDFDESVIDAPEPSTLALLASALLGLGLWQRKRRLLRR